MMQNEERINEMHQRAGRIKRKNEMIRTSVYGVTSFILMVVFVAVVIIQGSTVKNMDTGQYVGTSIFDASVGGYVLVALISFAVATVITVLCIRWKEKHETTKRQEKGESK